MQVFEIIAHVRITHIVMAENESAAKQQVIETYNEIDIGNDAETKASFIGIESIKKLNNNFEG